MSVLHVHLQRSLHKRQVEDSTKLVLIAGGCAILLLSIFLLFYRARCCSDKAAPSRLYPNIQLQHQGIPEQQHGVPQHVDGMVPSNYHSQPTPPARLGLRRDEDQFDTPAPSYYPREQEDPAKPEYLPCSRTRTPPPTYSPPAQQDYRPDGTMNQSITTSRQAPRNFA